MRANSIPNNRNHNHKAKEMIKNVLILWVLKEINVKLKERYNGATYIVKKVLKILQHVVILTVVSSSCNTWSYSDIATQKIIAVTSSKQWIHFLRSDLWPPTSNSLQENWVSFLFLVLIGRNCSGFYTWFITLSDYWKNICSLLFRGHMSFFSDFFQLLRVTDTRLSKIINF